MIFSVLMVLAGVIILICSFLEAGVWSSLYFDRDVYCIEKFRKITKATDLASCVHNLTKCPFALVLTIAGLTRWIPESNLGIVHTTLVVSYVLLVLDVIMVEAFTRALRLANLRSSFERQWHKEKKVSPEHNHEVNLYRGVVRVTRTFPRQIIIMGICILFLKITIFA